MLEITVKNQQMPLLLSPQHQQDSCLITADSQAGLSKLAFGKSIWSVPSHPAVFHVPGHRFQEDLPLILPWAEVRLTGLHLPESFLPCL